MRITLLILLLAVAGCETPDCVYREAVAKEYKTAEVFEVPHLRRIYIVRDQLHGSVWYVEAGDGTNYSTQIFPSSQ